MADLVAFHWGWLAGAFAIGLAMGWVAVVHRAPGVSRPVMLLLSALAAILVGAAVACLIPGRAGYWLELLLLLFVPYLVGCAIGTWLRALVVVGPNPLPEPLGTANPLRPAAAGRATILRRGVAPRLALRRVIAGARPTVLCRHEGLTTSEPVKAAADAYRLIMAIPVPPESPESGAPHRSLTGDPQVGRRRSFAACAAKRCIAFPRSLLSIAMRWFRFTWPVFPNASKRATRALYAQVMRRLSGPVPSPVIVMLSRLEV
jgi:hypothetical protein